MSGAWPVYLACAAYLATLSLGASVQYAHVRLGRWRIAHHLLFFLSWVAALGAAALGLAGRAWWWWLPLASLPVLAVFPRARAASKSHRLLAVAGLAVWAGILAGLLLGGA